MIAYLKEIARIVKQAANLTENSLLGLPEEILEQRKYSRMLKNTPAKFAGAQK